jgi:hypothetical protein
VVSRASDVIEHSSYNGYKVVKILAETIVEVPKWTLIELPMEIELEGEKPPTNNQESQTDPEKASALPQPIEVPTEMQIVREVEVVREIIEIPVECIIQERIEVPVDKIVYIDRVGELAPRIADRIPSIDEPESS